MVEESDNALLTGALQLATEGYKVFPVAGVRMDTRGQWICTCRKGKNCHEQGKADRTGKHPLFTTDWKALATTDEATIRDWWNTYPLSNVARATGNGIIVIDLDLPKKPGGRSGFEEWESIQNRLGAAPETLSVRTGSGGRHIFYREPQGRLSGQSLNLALQGAQSIDQRAKGGYVIAPPSRHLSGGLYAWENDCDIATAPDWLYDCPGPFAPSGSRRPSRSAVTATARMPLPTGELDPVVIERMKELNADIDTNATLTDNTMSMVRNAVPVGRRSEHVERICLGASARRFDPAALFFLLLDPENRGGERLQDEWRANPDRAVDWFIKTWQSAQQYRAIGLGMIDDLRREADDYPWASVTFMDPKSRRTSVRMKNLRRVMEASLDIAAETTTTRPMLSQGEIHQRTAVGGKPGLDPKTVRNALYGLEVLGWMVVAEVGGVFDASTYEFVLDPDLRQERLMDPTVLSGEYHLWKARNAQALLDLGMEMADAPLIDFDHVVVPRQAPLPQPLRDFDDADVSQEAGP